MPVGLFHRLFHQAYTPLGVSFGDQMATLSPTSWWRLGESVGTAAVDEQGNQNGVYQATPTLGVTGYASDDTGITLASASSEYVSIADNANWDFGTDDASFCIAFKIASTPASSQTLIARGDGDDADNWYVYVHPTAKRIGARFSQTFYDFDFTDAFADGEWHLLSGSMDRSGNWSMWMDGADEQTADMSGESSSSMDCADSFAIGASDPDVTPSLYLNGSVDEFAWWNGTLITGTQWANLHAARAGTSGGGGGATQSDTYAAAVLDLSPDAYYTMADSTSVMADASTNGNDGSYQGSPSLGVAGPFTGATGVTFNGTDQWAQAPYTSALDGSASDDWSIVLWAKTSDTTDAERWLVGRPGSGWDSFELVHVPADDELRSRFYDAAESSAVWRTSSTTTDLNDGTWRMWAITADRDGSVTFYEGGSAYGSASISAYAHELTGTHVLYLARRDVGNYWSGSLSHVSVWMGTLLSGSDISDLWTAAGN